MPSILFVCTANRFRSPLAAAYFRKALEEEQNETAADWLVGSAGTWASTGQPVLPAVDVAARKNGVDLASHRSICVSRQLLSEYDLILVMQASQREALRSEFPPLYEHIYLLSHVVEHGVYDIPDSFNSDKDVAEVSAELYALTRRGLRNICDLATSLSKKRDRTT